MVFICGCCIVFFGTTSCSTTQENIYSVVHYDSVTNSYWRYGNPNSVPGAVSVKYGWGTNAKFSKSGELKYMKPLTQYQLDSLARESARRNLNNGYYR